MISSEYCLNFNEAILFSWKCIRLSRLLVTLRAGHLQYLLIFSLMKNDIFLSSYLTGGRLFKWEWRKNRLQGIGLLKIGTFYK